MSVCKLCRDAADGKLAGGHVICQSITDLQQAILPFALSSCTCQHKPPMSPEMKAALANVSH